MGSLGIALDLGTSGFRAQAIDLETEKTLSTAITTRHPIPGSNVIDHINFAIDAGENEANRLIVDTVERLLPLLRVDMENVTTMAVCGNPFQLSLFQKIEIRDLAYAGKKMLETLKVVPPKRDGDVVPAVDLGLRSLPRASVVIPPAVGHEIGADALAMLLMTGSLEEEEPCLVIDYGTNAEMALVKDGEIYSGSAAAGPALEGQQIEMGMLAAPGTISDVNIKGDAWECWVLDRGYEARLGDSVDPVTGAIRNKGAMHGLAKGITGTGVVAAVECGISSNLIKLPKIGTPDGLLHLQDGIHIAERDVAEAGKAIGALRAGYLTLMREVGLWVDDVPTSFMSGASGLYVDALKAQRIGMVSPGSSRIVQYGNTSLALARDLAIGKIELDDLRDFARKLRATHCMFATSETFKNLYSIELSLWSYGMPMSSYNEMLDIYSLPHLRLEPVKATVERRVSRDIPDLGEMGVTFLDEPGAMLIGELDGCIQCGKCVNACPEDALAVVDETTPLAWVRSDLCLGTACKRCELVCPEHVMKIKLLRVAK
ncbi:MAG: methylamine methyltransferase corrinoid protein reductive activase [Methanomassiliicoccus sp.]|nr:methylamine methyltransferase corrinoid protein reductive activase [Methanomassiliicoccus sp.]